MNADIMARCPIVWFFFGGGATSYSQFPLAHCGIVTHCQVFKTTIGIRSASIFSIFLQGNQCKTDSAHKNTQELRVCLQQQWVMNSIKPKKFKRSKQFSFNASKFSVRKPLPLHNPRAYAQDFHPYPTQILNKPLDASLPWGDSPTEAMAGQTAVGGVTLRNNACMWDDKATDEIL